MNLIRLGSRYVNLDYLILAEEWDAQASGPAIGPGCLRLTIETGRILDLPPPEADKLRRKLVEMLDEAAPSAPLSPPPPPPGSGVHVSALDEQPDPPPARQRKRRG